MKNRVRHTSKSRNMPSWQRRKDWGRKVAHHDKLERRGDGGVVTWNFFLESSDGTSKYVRPPDGCPSPDGCPAPTLVGARGNRKFPRRVQSTSMGTVTYFLPQNCLVYFDEVVLKASSVHALLWHHLPSKTPFYHIYNLGANMWLAGRRCNSVWFDLIYSYAVAGVAHADLLSSYM